VSDKDGGVDNVEGLVDVNINFDLDQLWKGSVEVVVHHEEENDVSGACGNESRKSKKKEHMEVDVDKGLRND